MRVRPFGPRRDVRHTGPLGGGRRRTGTDYKGHRGLEPLENGGSGVVRRFATVLLPLPLLLLLLLRNVDSPRRFAAPAAPRKKARRRRLPTAAAWSLL